MPHLSDRAQKIPISPIRKLASYAEEAKAQGTHVYHLNIGQPDLETPKAFFDAIEKADLQVLPYSPSAGILSLRQKIRRYYQGWGQAVAVDEMIVTTGASEALQFLAGSIINPGDEILIPEPFYANYISLFIAAGAEVVPIPTRIDDGYRLPGIEAFESRITPRTKAILVCNPNNPTGALYSEESLRRLGELVMKHDLFLVADEVYREFVYENQSHFSVLSLSHAHEHVILIDSISKRFSACGARIGCIISRNQEVVSAIMKLAQIRLCPPTMGQIGAEALYDLPQSYYDSVVAEYVKRRNLVVEGINEIPGAYCPPVGGAFYAMVKLPIDHAESFCQWMLTDFTHNGATVMLAPGEGFYQSPGMGKDQVRIAYILNENDLGHALNCLAEGLKVYPGRTSQPDEVSRPVPVM